MADTPKKSTESKPVERKLAPAGASGDAGVQNLLGQRAVLASHPDEPGHQQRLADIDQQLADLGFTAQ